MFKNSFLFLTIFYCVVVCPFTQLYGTEINKTFAKKEYIELQAILGSCKVIKSEDDMIHINLIYSFRDDEYHPDFSESEDKLSLEEEFSNKSPLGKSLWIIAVPGNTKINFKSGTGNFSAEGVESGIKVETGTGSITINEVSGDFRVSTGAGSIEIRNSKGTFELSSGTGNLDITDIIIEGRSKFSSGTGSVSVTLFGSSDQDISISSGTGNAILDYQENPLKGFFKFAAIQGQGRIVSPVKFENEETTSDGNFNYEIKSFRIDGKDEPRIRIMTGPGLAKLIK